MEKNHTEIHIDMNMEFIGIFSDSQIDDYGYNNNRDDQQYLPGNKIFEMFNFSQKGYNITKLTNYQKYNSI
ncbi:MAG: hypothetical protein P8Y97_17985 [Candidatus Lokiarchaeota archaeon]